MSTWTEPLGKLEKITDKWYADDEVRGLLYASVCHLCENHTMHLDVIDFTSSDKYACGVVFDWSGECFVNMSVNQYAEYGTKAHENAKLMVRNVKESNIRNQSNVWPCGFAEVTWFTQVMAHADSVWRSVDNVRKRFVWALKFDDGTYVQIVLDAEK
jgi:hypothetical protein